MNILKGKIASFTTNGSLTLVKVAVNESMISAILIESPSNLSFLKKDHVLKVIFKETEVIIGSGYSHNISMQNKFIGQITKITQGELLSKLTVQTNVGELNSIITSNAVKQLNLDIGTDVTAMVKTNEIMLTT